MIFVKGYYSRHHKVTEDGTATKKHVEKQVWTAGFI